MKTTTRVVFLAVLVFFVNGQSLSQIKSNIDQTKRINEQTVGSKITGLLSIAIHQNNISLGNITFNLTPTVLTVQCQTTVYGARVAMTFYFIEVSNEVELAFTAQLSGSFAQFYNIFNNGKALPQSLKEIKGSGTVQVSFSSSTYAPNSIAKGVTVQGSASIVNGSLLAAVRWFQPTITQLQVTASLFINVFGPHPEDVSLQISTNGPIQLSKTLVAQSLQIDVTVPDLIDLTLALQATVNGPTKLEILYFHLSGEFLPTQGKLSLSGDMTGIWTHPLGINWLTINSAKATLVLANDNSKQLSIVANGALSFSSSVVTIDISVSGPDSKNIFFEIQNFPISKSLDKIFSDITGITKPTALSQVTTSGTATLVIATVQSGSFRAGVTLQVDATVTESGNVIKAVRIIKPDASTTTFTYVADLYVSIFGNKEAELSLKETGKFSVTKHTSCDDFSLDFDATTDTKIVMSAEFETTTGDGNILKYSVSGNYDEGSNVLQFAGVLEAPWNQPFGLHWLTIGAAKISFTLGGSQMQQFILSGSASLSFVKTGPVSLALSLAGTDLSEVYFSATGIPIGTSSFDSFATDVLRLPTSPTEFKSVSVQGTANLQFANYDGSQAPKGVSLSAEVTVVNTASDLYKMVKYFISNPATHALSLKIFSPIFSPSPSVTLSLSETGPIPLTSSITTTSITFDATIGASTSLSVSADLSVTLRHQPTPLPFSVHAAYSSQSLSLSGNMAGAWINPFGLKWLTLNAVSISVALGPSSVSSLSLAGSGIYKFGQDTGSASVSFAVANNFLDVTFAVTINNQWTMKEIAFSITGGSAIPSFLGDLQTATESVTLTVDTTSGITIDTKGKVTGATATNLKRSAYWSMGHLDVQNLQWDAKVNFPVFSTNPADVTLTLTWMEEVKLTNHLSFESVAFQLAAVPFSIGLDVKVKAQFNSNPTLYFEVNGSFKGDGSVILWGAMEGTWVDPFNIKGFDLSNVILELGFTPELCLIDGCISDFGLGSELQIGDKIIKFDGNVAAPDFWNIFFAGSISRSTTGTDDQTMSVLALVQHWNQNNPKAPVSQSGLESSWGLTQASFYFAPIDGQFGPIYYQRGFGITGHITILDMDIFASVNCTEDTGLSCSFAFDVNFDLDAITNLIKKELLLEYREKAPLKIFSIKQASLTNWSQQEAALGIHPKISMVFDIIGIKKTVNIQIQQDQLQQSFHDFFHQWLKHLF